MDTKPLHFVAVLAASLLAATASADRHLEPEAAATPGSEAAGMTMPAGAERPLSTPPDAPSAAAAAGSVARARFTLEVTDREPSDAVSRLTNEHDRIFFFTEVHRFQGQELTHRWEYGGEIVAEVPFGIDGPRWRIYSSKALDPSSLGTWTVSVVDASGNVVDQQRFDYVAAAEPVEATPPVAQSAAGAHEVPPPAAAAE